MNPVVQRLIFFELKKKKKKKTALDYLWYTLNIDDRIANSANPDQI